MAVTPPLRYIHIDDYSPVGIDNGPDDVAFANARADLASYDYQRIEGHVMNLLRNAGLAASVILMLDYPAGATTPSESVLYSFKGDKNGSFPYAPLISDAKGTFYGTTTGFHSKTKNACGNAFQLDPPKSSGKPWGYQILHSFTRGKSDGCNPWAGVVKDPSGTLYGTTQNGGAYYPNGGTVFALTPPAAGSKDWTESIVHSFLGGGPTGSLIIGHDGVLYGTTNTGGSDSDAGSVFALTPPAKGQTSWAATTLYAFQGGADGNGPTAGLVEGSNGALYGTTYYGGTGTDCSGGKGCGTAFELTPPAADQTAWTETILYTFTGAADGGNPYAGLILDKSGALYGVTVYGGLGVGVAFKLTPPAAGQTVWTESVLHTFEGNQDGAGPYGNLILDTSGALYGTTLGGGNGFGTAFKLTPPSGGQADWTESQLFSFSGGVDGRFPYGGLVFDKANNLFGTTSEGGANDFGTVFEITP